MADDARKMAQEIAELKDAVRALQTSARLGYTSIDDGALLVKDAAGTVRQRVGRQADGSYTAVDYNGVTPPEPDAPILLPGPITVTIASYGNTADGSEWPYDFEAIEAHLSTSPGFTPSTATKVGEFTTGGGTQVIHGEPDVPLYVVLVGRNTSGLLGPISEEISATPEAVVTDEDLAVIENVMDGLTSRIESAEIGLDGLTAGQEAVTFNIEGVRGIADGAQFAAADAQTAADTAASLAAAAETAANSAAADVTVVEGRVTTVEGDVSSLTTRITTAETDVTAVEGRVSTNETDISSVEGRVTTAEGSLSTHETRLDGAESTISTHETRLDTAETDITAVESRVTTTEGDITAVDTRVSTAEGTLSTHEGRIDTAETTISTHESRLDGAESEIDSVTTIAAGKNTTTYSTVAPTTQANAEGDLWFVMLGSQVSGIYRGLGGTSWSTVTTLSDSVIANLDAGKITTGFLAAARIATASIIADKLAANAVTAAKIAAGAVEAGKLAAGAVEAGNIAAGAVQAGNVAAGAIQTADLDALAVTSDKIAANAITVGKIAVGAVTAGSLAADAITGKTITGGIFQTATTGERLVVDPSSFGGSEIAFYSGLGSENSPGRVRSSYVDVPDTYSMAAVTLEGPTLVNAMDNVAQLTLQAMYQPGNTSGAIAQLRGDDINLAATRRAYMQAAATENFGMGQVDVTPDSVQLYVWNDTSTEVNRFRLYEDAAYFDNPLDVAGRAVGSDTDWQYPTLNAGWVNYSNGFTVARYRFRDDRVYLEGLIRSGAGTIFTLPPGYRPVGGTLIFPVNTAAATPGRVDVDTAGNVTFMAGGNAYVSLAGISFFND